MTEDITANRSSLCSFGRGKAENSSTWHCSEKQPGGNTYMTTLLCVSPNEVLKTQPPAFHVISCVFFFVKQHQGFADVDQPPRQDHRIWTNSVCVSSLSVGLFQALKGAKLWYYIGQTFFGTGWNACNFVFTWLFFFFFILYLSVCCIMAFGHWSRTRCCCMGKKMEPILSR